jgi:hypothetical protein
VAINTSKLVVGGVAASVANLALGFLVFGMWLGPKMNAEMDAVIPGVSAKMSGSSNMTMGLLSQVIIGFVLVWTYAAMRPRFGPGPKTAALAALPVWLSGLTFYAGFMGMGLMSMNMYLTGACAALVINIIAANAGAFLYKEEGV